MVNYEEIDWAGLTAPAVAIGTRKAARQAARDLPPDEQERFVQRVMKRCSRERKLKAWSFTARFTDQPAMPPRGEFPTQHSQHIFSTVALILSAHEQEDTYTTDIDESLRMKLLPKLKPFDGGNLNVVIDSPKRQPQQICLQL